MTDFLWLVQRFGNVLVSRASDFLINSDETGLDDVERICKKVQAPRTESSLPEQADLGYKRNL
jgi:hypothetical protein